MAEYTDADEELAMANARIFDLEAALASGRRDLEAHMDAAKVREAALAESRGELAKFRAIDSGDVMEALQEAGVASYDSKISRWTVTYDQTIDLLAALAALEAPHESI